MLIHGIIGQVKIRDKCLADYGDRGMGNTKPWRIYLDRKNKGRA